MTNATVAVLPNSEPRKSGHSYKSCWYPFYAMFSAEFAEEVLTTAQLDREAVVLHPWLGAGTKTFVVARRGFRSIGVDINPAMVAIANGGLIARKAGCAAVEVAGKAAREIHAVETSNDDPLRGEDEVEPETQRPARS